MVFNEYKTVAEYLEEGTEKQELRDIFIKIIQDLKLEARNLDDFNELKRIKRKIKNYESRLKTLLPDFDFKKL